MKLLLIRWGTVLSRHRSRIISYNPQLLKISWTCSSLRHRYNINKPSSLKLRSPNSKKWIKLRSILRKSNLILRTSYSQCYNNTTLSLKPSKTSSRKMDCSDKNWKSRLKTSINLKMTWNLNKRKIFSKLRNTGSRSLR